MHSAIVVINMPEESHIGTASPTWNAFIADVDGLRQQKVDQLYKQQGVQLLAQNVWLVNFQQNPSAFAWLIVSAKRHNLHYGILQLNDPPQWNPEAFVPKAA